MKQIWKARKKIIGITLTSFILVLPFVSFAQKDSVVTFSEIVFSESAKQQDLFSRARSWVEKNFNDSKSVISISDKETGEISGKGIMNFTIAYQGRNTQVPVRSQFRFSVRVKDGKYKYEFTDFDIIDFWNTYKLGILRSEKGKDWFGTKKWSEIAYSETKAEIELNTLALINILKKEMNQSTDF